MALSDHYPDQICNLPEFEGQFDARKLSAENCDVLFATYPAGTVIDAHRHDTDNVGIITKGALVLTMDGESKTLSTGQWYHVPAQKEHSAEFLEDSCEIEFWFVA
ncbi:MAG: cupin domain-containing protein [Pseudohongiellaceae bacterium]